MVVLGILSGDWATISNGRSLSGSSVSSTVMFLVSKLTSASVTLDRLSRAMSELPHSESEARTNARGGGGLRRLPLRRRATGRLRGGVGERARDLADELDVEVVD